MMGEEEFLTGSSGVDVGVGPVSRVGSQQRKGVALVTIGLQVCVQCRWPHGKTWGMW